MEVERWLKKNGEDAVLLVDVRGAEEQVREGSRDGEVCGGAGEGRDVWGLGNRGLCVRVWGCVGV